VTEQSETDSTEQGTRSHTGAFFLELYLIVTGLALAYGVQAVLEQRTVGSFIRFLIVLNTAVVWLHGQIGFSTDDAYEWSRNWFRMAIEHYVEIGSAIAILIPALMLKTEVMFFVAVAGAYAFDLILEALYVFESRDSRDARKRKVAVSWIAIDISAVLSIGLITYLRARVPHISENVAATVALAVVFSLTLVDYSRNRDFYFGLALKQKGSKALSTRQTALADERERANR
jgi:hypothetical protein